MSEVRRSRLLTLAAKYGLMIVEDDIYGRLAYDAPTVRPLKAADDHNLVVYLDSFSKVLLPGLRIGFMVPPPSLKENMLSLLRARELCVSSLLQRALAEFLRRGFFQEHLERVLPVYRKKRDVLLEALAEFMPEEVTWTSPQGGFSVWISLPESSDFEALYRTALARGVAYTPGEVFLATPDPGKHLRLCYGAQPEDVIRKAISGLSDIVIDLMARQSTRAIRLYGPKPIV
jgi:2-aminoadipate transaminase